MAEETDAERGYKNKGIDNVEIMAENQRADMDEQIKSNFACYCVKKFDHHHHRLAYTRACNCSLDTGAVPTTWPGKHGQSSTSTSAADDDEDEDESSDIIDDEGKPRASVEVGLFSDWGGGEADTE